MQRWGKLESAIMEHLWARDAPSTVRELYEELLEKRSIAYTTVMSTMDTLFKKGVLRREPDGRAYRYTPVMTREENSARWMTEALSASDDRAATLMHFTRQISPQEAAELREALEQAIAEASP
ncbi:BlaI/MecI/CopY family transcriptional regulator [Amycolatopsis sp. H6(2020)]|nr:BlaI/MecI/CopY family transcriptional regulator [Amycolatopsis sp. H6(2020)]